MRALSEPRIKSMSDQPTGESGESRLSSDSPWSMVSGEPRLNLVYCNSCGKTSFTTSTASSGAEGAAVARLEPIR